LDAFEPFDTELAEPLRRHERVVRDDAHAEAGGSARDLLANAPEPEHAECLVRELDATVRLPLPASLLQRGMCLRDVTSERYEQADGVLCGRDHGGFRRVGDDD